MAHDAIQAIKQLRRDVVEAMRSLMKLAKDKETSGMLPICEDMISKTRILLSLWDPGLVEEALTFLEEHKVAKIPDDDGEVAAAEEDEEEDGEEQGGSTNKDSSSTSIEFKVNKTLSPFKRITQHLNFELKNSDFDDFISPDTPECVQDLWAEETTKNKYTSLPSNREMNRNFVIFPDVEDENASRVCESQSNTEDNNNVSEVEAEEVQADHDDDAEDEDAREEVDLGKRFLDTQKMCNSPSANYYKPTDEPEPWDLTQLNIEASVMCLVSKVKFLCGRCSSPAVRLRNKNSIERSQSLKTCYSSGNRNVVSSVVTIQPKNGIKSSDESSKLLNNNGKQGSLRQQQQQRLSSPSRGADKGIAGCAKAKEGTLRCSICIPFDHCLIFCFLICFHCPKCAKLLIR